MARVIAVAILLLSISQISGAAFTDFEDLPDNHVDYPIGSVVESKGLSFEVVPFSGLMGSFASGTSDITGETLIGTGNAGLVFALPPNANHISFDYAVGNSSGMIINGVTTPLADAFEQLDGTTVGGVLIAIGPPPSIPFFDGRMTLTGEIDSFVIGGVEFFIDNVAVFVPEPSTAVLMLLASPLIACRRH